AGRGPEGVALRLVPVAELAQPVALAVRAGEDALYVAEKGGRLRVVRGGAVDPTPVLDLSGEVSKGGEQGLLGVAFAPAGTHVYVNYTDRAGDTRVVEYAVADGRVDPSSRRELLVVDQPFANHNGGQLTFGPDGLLYVGLGDGGSGNDPMDNAQRLDTLLGKLLRIDPRPSTSQPYTVPPGNPFAGRAGARPEIWAYGLRNPWRFSFDRTTKDLWIGDVGQNAREEVDRVPGSSTGGENYGWSRLEGTTPVRGRRPPGAVDPVHEYRTANGNCAVTGGYVYRGAQLPALQGTYVFADFCRGQLMGLRSDGAGRFRAAPLDLQVDNVSSFGEDQAGELYVLSLSGPVLRLAPP
ncbi:MAG: PQQ-dependent sugar dehydrogenase, partial [Actinomycetota bacterium]|nr:PQQ-dependent sugar dehydrogenase [Actinomycetota bacterium]